MAANNLLQGQTKKFRGLQLIPIVVRWTTGTPAIVSNPTNEVIALTDNDTGDLTLTLADASKAPLIVAGQAALGASNSAKNGTLLLHSAPTTTVVRVLYKEITIAAADNVSSAAADPVDLHLLIAKTIEN